MKQLLSIQSELNAPKDLKNTFGGYSYRSTESILAALKPLLSKHECVINITDDLVCIGNKNYVKATATITSTEDGKSVSSTSFAREEETLKGMQASQITGATSSYARKYALNGLFAIDDTKDADATNDHGKIPISNGITNTSITIGTTTKVEESSLKPKSPKNVETPKPPVQKPWLNRDKPEWESAIKQLENGTPLKVIQAMYAISKENVLALEKITKK